MTIFYTHPDIKTLPATRVVFTDTDHEFEQVMVEKDLVLALGAYAERSFPMATRVEVYVKREDVDTDLPKHSTIRNDYLFVNGWGPEKSREEAIVAFYRASTEQDQKSYFNERVE